MAAGELTPSEAGALARLVEAHRRTAAPPAPDFAAMLRREGAAMASLFAEAAPPGPAAEGE